MRRFFAFWLSVLFLIGSRTSSFADKEETVHPSLPAGYGTLVIRGNNTGLDLHVYSVSDATKRYDYFSLGNPVGAPEGDYKLVYLEETLSQFAIKQGQQTKLDLSTFFGSFRITADMTSGQDESNYDLLRCNPGSGFIYERLSCWKIKRLEVNTSILVPIGVYQVLHSNMAAQNIRVTGGSKSSVPLTHIRADRSPSAFRFQVFVDFTSKDERNKLLLARWSNSINHHFMDVFCGSFPSQCSVWDSPWSLDGIVTSFGSAGDLSTLQIKEGYWPASAKWTPYAHLPVGAQLDTGDFVSVLPGVYGVDLYDAGGRISATVYGIDTTKGNIHKASGISVY